MFRAASASLRGVSRGLVKAATEEGAEAFRGNGHRTSLEQEIFQLRQQVKRLEEEKEILKKASAYFAKHQR